MKEAYQESKVLGRNEKPLDNIFLQLLAYQPLYPGVQQPVSCCMNGNVKPLNIDQALNIAFKTLQRCKVPYLVVVYQEYYMGVLRPKEIDELDSIENLFVYDALCTKILPIQRDTTIKSAMELLAHEDRVDEGITALPITDINGLFVGIVGKNDIVEYLLYHDRVHIDKYHYFDSVFVPTGIQEGK